ncbi:MAG TPA: hypothetical protein VKU77_23820 [Streptosporangiaceae bacterium]|nr:hypothetical protein [Streptosporangiaceae bacterium]
MAEPRQHWTPEATCRERVTQTGLLREWHDVTAVQDGRVVFDAHNVFADGEDRVYSSILFFRSAGEFQRELETAGFTDITCTGGWSSSSADDRSPLLVFRSRRV